MQSDKTTVLTCKVNKINSQGPQVIRGDYGSSSVFLKEWMNDER